MTDHQDLVARLHHFGRHYTHTFDDDHLISQACDLIERLMAELEEAKKPRNDYQAAAFAMKTEVERQAAELEALRKDAGRYRWLRSKPDGREAARIVNDTPHGMDAAIDAAMKEHP